MRKKISVLCSLIIHDLLIWKRNPFAIMVVFLPPFGMALILITLSLAVLQQPVALVVEGHGSATQKMQKIIVSDTDAYVNADFSTTLKPLPAAEAQKLLDEQLVAAIITIPKEFDSKAKKNEAKVQLTLNNVDIDFADDIRRSVDRSVAHYDAPILSPDDAEEAGKEFEAEAPNPYLMTIDEEDLRETNVDWLSYQMIPTILLLLLSVGLIGTALFCAQDRLTHTAYLLMLSPVGTSTIIFGRLLSGTIASLIAVTPVIALCVFFGIIALPLARVPQLVLLLVLTSLCASGIGAIIGTLIKSYRIVAVAASVAATYLYFLGGGFTTIAFLPPWLQTISSFVPTTYAIEGMRQILFYQKVQGLGLASVVLGVSALLAVILGGIFMRRMYRTTL